MRTLAALAFAIAALGFSACGTETATYHNAITGKTCTPDMQTFVQLGTHGSKHPGCDSNRCCIVVGGECDHPDAGAGSGTGSGSGSGSDPGPF